MDAPKAVASVARTLGPGHFLAGLLILVLAGGGYILLDRFMEDHTSLGEQMSILVSEVHTGTDHADARAAEFREMQSRHNGLLLTQMQRLTAMMTATCYSQSNGDRDSRRFCEDALAQ